MKSNHGCAPYGLVAKNARFCATFIASRFLESAPSGALP
jgi:hypothetical protein